MKLHLFSVSLQSWHFPSLVHSFYFAVALWIPIVASFVTLHISKLFGMWFLFNFAITIPVTLCFAFNCFRSMRHFIMSAKICLGPEQNQENQIHFIKNTKSVFHMNFHFSLLLNFSIYFSVMVMSMLISTWSARNMSQCHFYFFFKVISIPFKKGNIRGIRSHLSCGLGKKPTCTYF